MLLNLSNHPSSKWTPAQLSAAIEQYGSVEDWPFPNIAPEATVDDIRLLAEQYTDKIRRADPMAVHLMGEMTFTFRLVTMLQAVGIPCIASTTHRTVEERDGKKIVLFEFVQFRHY